MKELKEKRELLIENKIFTENDLISLIKLVIKLSDEILDKSKEIKNKELIHEGWTETNISEKYINTSHSGIEFTSSDKSKYSFSFKEISEAKDVLDTKQIIEVELHFSENVLDSKFVLKLRHSDTFSASSYVLVEGEDRDWVNGTIRLLKNFLATCRNQSTFVEKNKILIFGSTILLLILFLHNLVVVFIRTKVIFPKIVGSMFSENLIYVIMVLSLISATPAVLIYKWLIKLFPGIEIQTGLNYDHAKKERRNKLLLLAILIIVPSILSFFLLRL
jgi:hypothetical protein